MLSLKLFFIWYYLCKPFNVFLAKTLLLFDATNLKIMSNDTVQKKDQQKYLWNLWDVFDLNLKLLKNNSRLFLNDKNFIIKPL